MTGGRTRIIARKTNAVGRTLKWQAGTLFGTMGVFWTAFVANTLLGGSLAVFGVIPRSVTGLRGIAFAPFLHANLAHLISNTIPFLVLGWLVMLRDARHFLPVTLFSMLGAGVLAWAVGAPGSVHIGASGVVFGYLGFLLLSGWYARSAASMLLSLGVAALWGGLVLGAMPGTPGISWQSHLGGFVGGVLAARHFGKRG